MTPFQLDKLARVEDIEALLQTSLELTRRLGEREMADAANYIRKALTQTGHAKTQLVAKWVAGE